jgi:hypothetical protein
MGNRTKKSINLLRVIGMVIVSVGVNMGHALNAGEYLVQYKDGGTSKFVAVAGEPVSRCLSIRMIAQRVLLRLRPHVVAA